MINVNVYHVNQLNAKALNYINTVNKHLIKIYWFLNEMHLFVAVNVIIKA